MRTCVVALRITAHGHLLLRKLVLQLEVNGAELRQERDSEMRKKNTHTYTWKKKKKQRTLFYAIADRVPGRRKNRRQKSSGASDLQRDLI